MNKKLTAKAVSDVQKSLKSIKPLTIGAYKRIGREFADKYGLTDREAIDLMNGRNEIEILSRREEMGK